MLSSNHNQKLKKGILARGRAKRWKWKTLLIRMLDLPDEWIERTVNSIRYQTFSFPDCTILRL
jgi:hypothetical protein